MKSHVSIFALLAAYIATLAAIVVLLLNGQKIDGLAGLGFGAALGTIIGTIGGIAPPGGSTHANSTQVPLSEERKEV